MDAAYCSWAFFQETPMCKALVICSSATGASSNFNAVALPGIRGGRDGDRRAHV